MVRWLAAMGTLGALALAPAAAGAPGPVPNDCGDEYWQNTLRCTVHPNPPQPNANDRPTDANQIKPFTRVFLARNLEVRALDGTIPTIYVDKAVCPIELCVGDIAYGKPVESNKWVITVPGGSTCSPLDTDDDLVYDDAQSCYDDYVGGFADDMGTALDAPMRTMDGIHDPDPALNPVFAGFNRIRVEKSSYDRYMGRTAYTSDPGVGSLEAIDASGAEVRFDTFHHGFFIWSEALGLLRKGLRYRTWRPDGHGGVKAYHETLPPLADAETVLFAAHSGGAHGMYHNIDNLAGVLDTFPRFDGDVRVLLDENFIPSIQGESVFQRTGGDAFDGPWSGTAVTDNHTEGFTYDGEDFHRTGEITGTRHDAWGAERDASCMAVHDTDPAVDETEWMCDDRHHVLLHHISTPFFLKQSINDPGSEHTNHGAGHSVQWGECGVDCTPLMTPTEYADRVAQQAKTLVERYDTASELALGVDDSGTAPTRYVWITDCDTHEGAYDPIVFFETRLADQTTAPTMREYLQQFVVADRTGASNWRIVGYPADDPIASSCPEMP